MTNPIRYNRRNLSQPYPAQDSVRCSEAIFHITLPDSSQPERNLLCKAAITCTLFVTAFYLFINDKLTQATASCQ